MNPDTRSQYPQRVAWLRVALLGASDGFVSAARLLVGAGLLLVAMSLMPVGEPISWLTITALAGLSKLAMLAAQVGGANPWHGAWRVIFWGALVTAAAEAAGRLFGAAG